MTFTQELTHRLKIDLDLACGINWLISDDDDVCYQNINEHNLVIYPCSDSLYESCDVKAKVWNYLKTKYFNYELVIVRYHYNVYDRTVHFDDNDVLNVANMVNLAHSGG